MTEYPDPRRMVDELVHGKEFAGRLAKVYFQLQNDYLQVAAEGAAVLVHSDGGREGDYDRVDRVTVEVYAPGTLAKDVAEKIRSVLVNDGLDHDLEAGYFDHVRCDVTPYDIPFTSEKVNLARSVYLVTMRPL